MHTRRTQRHNLVFPHDIPGSKCVPEDGSWPRPFRLLEDSDIWRGLASLANPHSWKLQTRNNAKQVDALNFQPCPLVRTQDRYVVQQLEIHGKLWTLTAVFDGRVAPNAALVHDTAYVALAGHLGDLTVEHVARNLPIIIRDSLRDAFRVHPSRLNTNLISNVL